MPFGTARNQSTTEPLKPAVVTTNLLKFAIAVTFIRPYPDKSHNCYPNGE